MSYSINRYNNLLDPFFDAVLGDSFHTEKFGSLQMKTDITESENAYELSVELPGIKKENIEISYKDGYLTVKASAKTLNAEDKKTNFIHRERFSGSAYREYYVGDIDEKAIAASFNDGLLVISFPKKKPEEEKPHNIAIN